MSFLELFVKTAHASSAAVDAPAPEEFQLPNPFDFSGGGGLEAVIGNLVGIVLVVLGLVAFGYLLYGGALFLTSQGDSEKVTNARNTILYSIIGIVVVALSWGLFVWVNNILSNSK